MAKPIKRGQENPLVPHAALRAMYLRMMEARLLEEHLGTLRRSGGQTSIRGEEACRAAAMQCLRAGDLVSDPSVSAASDLMLGVSARKILGSHPSARAKTFTPSAPNRLPLETSLRAQLRQAVGAAHALKLQRRQEVVLVFCAPERDSRLWREVLGEAGSRELPLIFLVTPPQRRLRRGWMVPGLLSDRSREWGIPGIPVDAGDGVALYRVLSEATLRARSGDGPALLEGVRWDVPGRRSRQTVDPLIAMALALLVRNVSTVQWQANAARRCRAKLDALQRSRGG